MGTKTKGLELSRGAHVREPCGSSAEPQIEHLVRRFAPERRAAVRRLVSSSTRIADLATVFPGALYAIAARQGPATRRRRALELVENGAALREVAHALDLPLWLRRLPPEAFSGQLVTIPKGEMFARRIANQLPRTNDDPAFWLNSVIFAEKACDEQFAVWLAAQPLFREGGAPERLFALLSAYAWFSSAELTRAYGLLVVPWRREMALDAAILAAKSWLNRMRLVMQLGKGALTDAWLEGGEVRGYAFVPLLEQEHILAEAHAMQNCADQYADRLARDKCRIFSVRRRGVRVATLEIGPHPREAGVLAISQLKSRHNMPASQEVWQAAHTWLGLQKDLKRSPALNHAGLPFDCETWRSLIAPYRTCKRGAPWLPQSATRETFAALDADIADLARRAGITSWLFT